MTTTNLFGMNFPKDSVPDFGSIRMDKKNEYLHLLQSDIGKLNGLLTRTVCVDTYGADQFSFGTGDVAFVDNTQQAFVYNPDSDSWHEWEI